MENEAKAAGLDDVIAHGVLSMGYLARMLNNWVPQQKIRSYRTRFTAMTNVYISSLMVQQRFDVVLVEEAGMAVLPSLFYCTALGHNAVMVGDPQQLPPII